VQSVNDKNIDPVSESTFWSLSGINVQFTWFDVPAKTHFKNHKHESEQITYVLEGELFFESNDSIYKLSKGDCILIPGNTDHRVWTENIPAMAVDAWSPVNNAYSSESIYKIKKYSHEK
jgi:quercetin dioxygenase-like cupin family protein